VKAPSGRCSPPAHHSSSPITRASVLGPADLFLARELTSHSTTEIGRGIGGRDHATVLHAVNRVGAAIRSDSDMHNAVDNLRRRLGRPAG
jgi:hypothetical protein